jgi:hypothetical protein
VEKAQANDSEKATTRALSPFNQLWRENNIRLSCTKMAFDDEPYRPIGLSLEHTFVVVVARKKIYLKP